VRVEGENSGRGVDCGKPDNGHCRSSGGFMVKGGTLRR
jgi:hypothetical protein